MENAKQEMAIMSVPRPQPIATQRKNRGITVLQVIMFVAGCLIAFMYISNENRKEEMAAREKELAAEIKRKERQAAAEKWEAEAPMREERARRREAERLERERADRLALEKDAGRRLYALIQKFHDVNAVASSAPRIALSGPVQSIQQIVRDVRSTPVTPCLSPARSSLAEGMTHAANMYLAFMRQEDIERYKQDAASSIKTAQQQMVGCLS